MIQYSWEEINYLQSVTGCIQNSGEETPIYIKRLIQYADSEFSDEEFYGLPINVQWYLNQSILTIIRGWRHEKN
jgi:hypothetical protein